MINCLSAAQNNIEVDAADRASLDALIENRDGKLLLINIWATWCIPCREEFPDLVKISDTFSEELEVVALSVDFKDEVEKKVLPFLIEQEVNFKVLINEFKKDENLINYFNKDWTGAIPATFIYDKKGKQIKFIEGKQSYESFSSSLKDITD